MPKIDLTNQQFEYFTVLGRNEQRTRENGRNVFWNCRCHCGNIFVATTTDINKGKRKSCGCMAAALTGQAHFQDLTGEIFGDLEVLERDFNHPQHGQKPRTYWKCKCACGNIVSVERTHLVGRGQSSCGCQQSIGELNINKLLSMNNIKYRSQYTDTTLKTDRGGFLKFDFALLDDNNCPIRFIEFDGNQHYQENNYFPESLSTIQQRDILKNKYAQTMGIPLVRIPYYKRDCMTLEDLLGDKFILQS